MRPGASSRGSGGQAIGLLEIVFSVVSSGGMPYVRSTMGAFLSIIQRRIGFVGNLVRAGGAIDERRLDGRAEADARR